MKTILICNQKGGCGKSTIADNIAWSLERTNTPYNFYDMDGQGGVIHETAEMDGAEIAVIDTPGALQPEMRKWMEAADCIVIPTKTTRMDIKPLQRMMDLVEDKTCPVIYVVNGVNRYTSTKVFEEWFSSAMPPRNICMKIPQAEAIAQASIYGESVVTYAPKSPAAIAMKELINLIRLTVGLKPEK